MSCFRRRGGTKQALTSTPPPLKCGNNKLKPNVWAIYCYAQQVFSLSPLILLSNVRIVQWGSGGKNAARRVPTLLLLANSTETRSVKGARQAKDVRRFLDHSVRASRLMLMPTPAVFTALCSTLLVRW